jgi:hypothetical protein
VTKTYIGNVIWRTEIMVAAHRERPEDRHVRADRIAREYISAERREREKKTAELRAKRLEMEKSTN